MTKALKKFFPVFAGPTLLAFMIAFIVPFFMGKNMTFSSWAGPLAILPTYCYRIL